MKKDVEAPSRRGVVGSLAGAGMGWTAGLWFPAMQGALGAAGSYFGAIVGDLVGQTDFAHSLRARHFLTKQLRTDFRNSCLGSPGEVSAAHRYGALLLERGGIIRARTLAEQRFASIDFRGSLGVATHARVLRQGASQITISCPALFPAALSVCLALRDKLAAHDISLQVDSTDPTSRSQVISLSSNFSTDFAIMADPPLFMSSDSRRARDRYRLVLPCFWHEDAIVGSSAAIAGPSPSSSLVYYHAESTAELMLRTSMFWGDARYRQPIVDPSVASALRAALSAGHYVTTWEPLTSVLLNRFSDLTVVPNTRFKSYVSIFANRSWLSPARARRLSAFLSLFSDQWHRMQVRPNPKSIRKFDVGMERFGRTSGLTDLRRYN